MYGAFYTRGGELPSVKLRIEIKRIELALPGLPFFL